MGSPFRILAPLIAVFLIAFIPCTTASRNGGLLGFSRSLQSTDTSADNSTADICASVAKKLNSWDPVSPSEFKSCLTLFPINTTAARATVKTLLLSLDNYVFENMNRVSPSPELSGSVDIRAAVKSIGERIPSADPNPSSAGDASKSKSGEFGTAFTSEYEFHDALHLAFLSLNDGHTGYDTSCFQKFGKTLNGFPLVSVVENGAQKIKIMPKPGELVGKKITQQTEKLLGISLADYGGADVASIDGEDPVEFVRKWAYKHEGRLRDQSARFNAALARADFKTMGGDSTSQMVLVAGAFTERRELPEKDTITFVLQRNSSTLQETLHVPWLLAYNGRPFTDKESYFRNQCQVTPSAPPTDPSPELNADKEEGGVGGNTLDSGWGWGVGAQQESFTPIFDNYIKAYILPSTSIGVLLVPDVLFPDTQGERPSSLTRQFFMAMQTLKLNGAHKLILDFQNNVGGDIVDGYAFLSLLFPNRTLRQFPTQFRASQLIRQLVAAATKRGQAGKGNPTSIFFWGNWAETNGSAFGDAGGFFYPLVLREWGGVTEEFSRPFDVNPALVSVTSLFRESAAAAGAGGGGGGGGEGAVPYDEPLFAEEDIIFLTNGLCVSACATVAAYIEEMSNVTTVAVGGLKELAMAIENTGGGQVEGFDELRQEVSEFGLLDSPYAPAAFDWLKTDFRFAIRQDLSLEAPYTPLEFLFKPSHQRVMYSDANVLDQYQLYSDVSALFL